MTNNISVENEKEKAQRKPIYRITVLTLALLDKSLSDIISNRLIASRTPMANGRPIPVVAITTAKAILLIAIKPPPAVVPTRPEAARSFTL